jgi:uncharacterized protein YfbU (UPF0304 family)
MKLEFLANINEYDEHIVKLSDFDSAQARKFQAVVNYLVNEEGKYINITTLDFIQAVNCKVILRVSEEDLGIWTTDNIHFICDLTINSYKNIINLLEPFCKRESKGYQYLYDLDTPIDFLFSGS